MKVANKYPVLITKHNNAENWWNSLSWADKVDAGGICIHYVMMSANYSWYTTSKFSNMTNGMIKRVKQIFAMRFNEHEFIHFNYNQIHGALRF